METTNKKLEVREVVDLIREERQFDVSLQTVRNWHRIGVRGKQLPRAGKKGSRFLFDREDVLRFLDEINQVEPEEPPVLESRRSKTARQKRAEQKLDKRRND